jgi:hypothetical protein
VQAPSKYQLVLNLETAKTHTLTVSDTLLARVNEVSEQAKPLLQLLMALSGASRYAVMSAAGGSGQWRP